VNVYVKSFANDRQAEPDVLLPLSELEMFKPSNTEIANAVVAVFKDMDPALGEESGPLMNLLFHDLDRRPKMTWSAVES
jgi:hypothetical protein